MSKMRIKKFNEGLDSPVGLQGIKHNLNSKNQDCFRNGQTRLTELVECEGKWMGKKITIHGIMKTKDKIDESFIGFAILIDNKIEYLIEIYDPYDCYIHSGKGTQCGGLITMVGKENIINVFLESESYYGQLLWISEGINYSE